MKMIKDAKVAVRMAAASAQSRVQVARALLAYIFWEKKLNKLHPVRDAQARVDVGHKVRRSAVSLELATAKLKSN